jgi:dTDP-4-dehydrorhamnose reductase
VVGAAQGPDRWLMRWLVTGAGGMLGRDLCAVLAEAGESGVVAATRVDLDVTDATAVGDAVAGVDVVLNAAAWTDVDGAETAEDAATAVNGHAVRILAEAAGARLFHFSTDYVFDGVATVPYAEDAAPAPLNAYGRGKLVGERAVLANGGHVVRTAWLYGAHGRNFVRTMLRLAGERDTVDVVADQEGPPTWSYALAGQVVALAQAVAAGRAAPGVYHGTAGGQTTAGSGPGTPDDQRPVSAAGPAADVQRARAAALGRHGHRTAAGVADHAHLRHAHRGLIRIPRDLGVVVGAKRALCRERATTTPRSAVKQPRGRGAAGGTRRCRCRSAAR